MRRIALIGLTTLENIAIKNILENIPNIKVESFNNVKDLKDLLDIADRYIVSEKQFAMNIDIFLPRKTKTMVIGKGHEICKSGFLYLGDCGDMVDLYEEIEDFVKEKYREEGSKELTAREIEVLKELVAGLTIKEIADKLCISANTAVSHRKNISSKLGIRSVSGLSVYALMNGLI